MQIAQIIARVQKGMTTGGGNSSGRSEIQLAKSQP